MSNRTALAPRPRLSAAAQHDAVLSESEATCAHCGLDCGRDVVRQDGKTFCCAGCLTVHEILLAGDLGHFYKLKDQPGQRVGRVASREHYTFLDEPGLQEQLLDFSDGRIARVTLRLPAIHCVACVWLLENLFRLHSGVGESRVHFGRREAAITFFPDQIKLSELAALLSSVGYQPEFRLDAVASKGSSLDSRRRALQLGVSGFAFGNIMLFSIPGYLGLDSASQPVFTTLFGVLSLILAVPVLLFSASEYWRSAWVSLRERTLTLDVPIAVGLCALFAQSAFEILSGTGEGYLDSLSGLVFFLLCGRAFQRKTYDRLSFDRDYRSFFPLSVTRLRKGQEETVPLARVRVGDCLLIRNRELVPADATLVRGGGCIDYSFVTGESAPVNVEAGGALFAGGQQVGEAIQVETRKPVSQSYLTSLWDHEAFRKTSRHDLNTISNRYGRVFTGTVLAIALITFFCWLFTAGAGAAVRAFTAVIIVACPCALALAAPFALGTARRLLARQGVFVRNATVLERLPRVGTVALDKTGTLTSSERTTVHFLGPSLTAEERYWVSALAGHSMHPHAARIRESLGDGSPREAVRSFLETAGVGIEGAVAGHEVWLGSRNFLTGYGAIVSADCGSVGSAVHLAIDGRYRGTFDISHPLRPEIGSMVRRFREDHDVVLLSGDQARERRRFEEALGADTEMHFEQSPTDKLDRIRTRQQRGESVMMVGDGLNDAGALRQSDVGVAVVAQSGLFSPASDVIVEAANLARLPQLITFAKSVVRIVWLGLAVSALYNVVGISIAAMGWLSPLWCAVLMPLSSITVVLIASGATLYAARRRGFHVQGPLSDREQSALEPQEPVEDDRHGERNG